MNLAIIMKAWYKDIYELYSNNFKFFNFLAHLSYFQTEFEIFKTVKFKPLLKFQFRRILLLKDIADSTV